MQLMEQPHQNTVLNPAAPNFQPNQVASESNVIAAPLQFPQPVNSQHGLVSTGLSFNQNMAQPSQLCNNHFIPGSQLQSNLQAPVTSTIYGPMCINQQLNPVGQNQFSQPLIDQSLLPTVNQHISSVHSNTNVTQERGNNDFKQSIKMPPLKLQNFNGNPIHFYEWINNFNTMIHNNTSSTDTHRITYLQNSVSGKAKDLIRAYSCDPSFYQTALNELIRHFGDRTIVINAKTGKWTSKTSQASLPFPHFWKDLCKPSNTLALQQTSSLQHSLRKPKRKHHIIWFWSGLNIDLPSSAKTRLSSIFNNG